MNSRFKLSLVECGGGSFAAILYDLQRCRVVWEVTDYAENLISILHFKPTSIHQEIGHLRVFWAYLHAHGSAIEKFTDRDLTGFRDYITRSAENSPARRQHRPKAAKKTANAKLTRVYDWLIWLQETGRISINSIGRIGARVQSALNGSSLSYHAKENRKLRLEDKYPLLHEESDSRSKHTVASFIPTEETVDLLHETFFSKGSTSHIRHRNSMMVDFVAYSGFRRNSMRSLKVEQFIGDDYLTRTSDTVTIRPAEQKFGYQNTFDIPVVLHNNMRAFILTERAQLLRDKGKNESVAKGFVFLSDRNCTPLDGRTITAIVSGAMRANGAPKGAAVHAFRAKYAVEATEDEFEDRRERGLDTSEDTISRAVAVKLGHSNPESQRAYTARHASIELVGAKSRRIRKLNELKEENERLRLENDRLLQQLKDSR